MLNKNVVILGASAKAERYSNRAHKMLREYDYKVFPVARMAGDILGVPAITDLSDIEASIDTVTIYVRPAILAKLIDKVLEMRPRRVIFNPGAESEELAEKLKSADIVVTEACTMVLLRTGQFEDD